MSIYTGDYTIELDGGKYDCRVSTHIDENGRLDIRFNRVVYTDDRNRKDEVRLPICKLEALAQKIIVTLHKRPWVQAEYEQPAAEEPTCQ